MSVCRNVIVYSIMNNVNFGDQVFGIPNISVVEVVPDVKDMSAKTQRVQDAQDDLLKGDNFAIEIFKEKILQNISKLAPLDPQ